VSRLFKKVSRAVEAQNVAQYGERTAGRRARVGALVALAALAAVAAPQVVRRVRDVRAESTDAQLRALAAEFSRHQRELGAWPCWWGERSGQVELDDLACRVPASPGSLDAWGRPILAVYERPTLRIPIARNGVIALISAGADGQVSTSRRRAIAGQAAGDDRVHVVTRDAGLP
jgi:type II secretory pathway pseudopilin PulG